jgi:hypothetical protein
MDSNSILISFSQIALGFAGFASIYIALSGNYTQRVAINSFGIKSMLATSLPASFMPLVPILLTFFAIEENNKWYISLITLAIAYLIIGLYQYLSYRKLSRFDQKKLRKGFFLYVLLFMFICACVQFFVAFIYLDQAPGMFF